MCVCVHVVRESVCVCARGERESVRVLVFIFETIG